MFIVNKDNINPKINRDLYYICEKYIKSNENKILTITGNRRFGKTTILKTLNNKYKDSVMITLDNKDTLESIQNFITNNLDKYNVFLIDEFCLNQEIFDNSGTIMDYLISNNKKAIITGTYNLSIKLIEKIQSFGRTINYTLPTLTYLEYISIFDNDNYLDYINFTDFNRSSELVYIDSLINNILISYSKYIRYNDDKIQLNYSKVKFYIYLVLYKMVISSDENIKNIINAEGIKFSDKINENIINELRVKSKFFDKINIEEFNLLLEQLEKLKIIKFISSLDGSKVTKNLIQDFVLKRYIYNIIENNISKEQLSNFKITHYGLFYENIMNMQTSIYSENTFKQYYYKNIDGEIDDIIDFNDRIELIEYKSGLFKENKLLEDDNFKNKVKSMYGKSVNAKYVGKVESNLIQKDIKFLENLRHEYLNKFKNEEISMDWSF